MLLEDALLAFYRLILRCSMMFSEKAVHVDCSFVFFSPGLVCKDATSLYLITAYCEEGAELVWSLFLRACNKKQPSVDLPDMCLTWSIA